MNKTYTNLYNLLLENAAPTPGVENTAEEPDLGKLANYSQLLKNWRKMRDSAYQQVPFGTWERAQLPIYLDKIRDLMERRIEHKHYLSLEERADFRFMLYELSKARYPGMNPNEIDKAIELSNSF